MNFIVKHGFNIEIPHKEILNMNNICIDCKGGTITENGIYICKAWKRKCRNLSKLLEKN